MHNLNVQPKTLSKNIIQLAITVSLRIKQFKVNHPSSRWMLATYFKTCQIISFFFPFFFFNSVFHNKLRSEREFDGPNWKVTQ